MVVLLSWVGGSAHVVYSDLEKAHCRRSVFDYLGSGVADWVLVFLNAIERLLAK